MTNIESDESPFERCRRNAESLADFVSTAVQSKALKYGLPFSFGERSVEERELDDKDGAYKDNAWVTVSFECSIGDCRMEVSAQGRYIGQAADQVYIKCYEDGKSHWYPIQITDDPVTSKDRFLRRLDALANSIKNPEETSNAPSATKPALIGLQFPKPHLSRQTQPLEIQDGSTQVTLVLSAAESLIVHRYREARKLASNEDAIRFLIGESMADNPTTAHERARERIMRNLDTGRFPKAQK